MKAIILAAGRGSRLDKYTENLPKGMLSFLGMSLIERQIKTLRRCGINDISIVTGYKAEKIRFEGVKYYYNEEWADTNMLVSLMCAEQEFDDDVLVCYSDVIYSDEIVKRMVGEKADYAVAVDDDWHDYWKLRYGRVDFDLESLKLANGGSILSLGKPTESLGDCDARYIGVLKFSRKAICRIAVMLKKVFISYFDKPWQASGKTGKKAYMTDLIQELIDSGDSVQAVHFTHGWLEFDTNEDYEISINSFATGKLKTITGEGWLIPFTS